MNIKTQMVDFPSAVATTPGYFAQPDDGRPHPALVVIQEWWGLTSHIKEIADRFAQEGFVALAPDLYHGELATEPDEARKLAMDLKEADAVVEIQSAAQHLQSLEAVKPKMIGIIGWCMGGRVAIATAAATPDLGAVVVFYGGPRDLSIAAMIKSPLLGLYGSEDHGIPVETVRAFEKELQKNGVTNEFHIYEGAPHAFFNDSRPHIYQAGPARDAWKRTLEWFRKHLV